MLKHAYQDFPSDLFLLVETIGAKLMIISPDAASVSVTPLEFLATDMANKVLLFIEFPPTKDSLFTYKTMQRYPNLHHYFNKYICLSICLFVHPLPTNFVESRDVSNKSCQIYISDEKIISGLPVGVTSTTSLSKIAVMKKITPRGGHHPGGRVPK